MSWNQVCLHCFDSTTCVAHLVSQWTGIAPETVATMPRVENGEALVPADLQPVIDATVRDGVLKKAFPATAILYAPVTAKN